MAQHAVDNVYNDSLACVNLPPEVAPLEKLHKRILAVEHKSSSTRCFERSGIYLFLHFYFLENSAVELGWFHNDCIFLSPVSDTTIFLDNNAK